ncbi:hypothetical protein DQ04_16551000, partial [Trypanosoma grayi]|uniref:hypothetical protein n=1 Tax=Trypanosoma grayi TaxID=71804 RepID=UPI0004F46266
MQVLKRPILSLDQLQTTSKKSIENKKEKAHCTCSQLTLRLKHNSSASLTDLLVSQLAHPASLHDAGSLQVATAEQLRVAIGQQVNDGKSLALLRLQGLVPRNQLGD